MMNPQKLDKVIEGDPRIRDLRRYSTAYREKGSSNYLLPADDRSQPHTRDLGLVRSGMLWT